MDQLPQDALAAILARLAPRSLAASRCVCKDWRATIDARCNLRAALLPIMVGGIFVSLAHEPAAPAFFARQSMTRRIAGKLKGYVDLEDPDDFPYIMNSCNGLLLLYGRRVVNPATRQWACLPDYPPPPDGMEGIDYESDMYLVFDPAVSQHYEVFILPYVPGDFEFNGSLLEGTEWPPSKCIAQVFSSRTGTWEQRSFVREGEPAANIAHVKGSEPHDGLYHHGVYWHETLYVHCKGDFLMRTEWVLKNSIKLLALAEDNSQNHDDGANNRHWILQDGNYDIENGGPAVKTDSGWNSDDDNAPEIEDLDPEGLCGSRIVYREWRAIIDARRLLRTDSLPLSVGGIFLNVKGPAASVEFFARPSKGPSRISARIQDYVQPLLEQRPYITGCCNGLISGRACRRRTRPCPRG
ncbi:hypothetical protein QOZ80_3BG0266560 [Eleusine coracana subsp. coracana]|nr:hypothetical protein QOZ80_3BG0266560 [Eleusine coracana subsp. coracana]